MADETKPAAVTDSREKGFNPEVEESHAGGAAAVAAAAAATAAAASAAAAPPAPHDSKTVMLDLLRAIGDRLGNPPKLVALIKELEAL